MTTDNNTLADVQPGGRVRLEQESRDHRWDDVGERCLDCGDKDWMGGACSGPRAPEITAPWSPIGMAPNDGEPHIRGLWVTSRIDGAPATREWRQFIGLVNDDGAFVDPDYGETFGWEADQFDAWMPLADAPGAALSAQPSTGETLPPEMRLGSPEYLDYLDTKPSPGGQEYAWNIAELVRVDLDRQSCPDAYMRIAMESVVKHLAARQPVTMDDALAAGDGTLHGAIDHWQERALRAEAALSARLPVGISADWVLGYLNTDAPEESREAIRNAFAEYAALSGARQPVGEPIGWYTEDHLTDRSATTYDRAVADRWRAKGWPVSPLYTAPTAQAVDLGQSIPSELALSPQH